jgi:hypothetical protein
MLELAANGTESVGFKAPDAIAGNVMWTLPSVVGSTSQVLTRAVAANTLEWANSNGSAITTSSAGGTHSLVLARNVDDFPFKGLTAGSNITITPSGTDLTIASTGGGGGATYLHVESTGGVAVTGNLESSPLAGNSSVTTNTSDLTYTASTGVVNIITDGIYTFNGTCTINQNLVPPGAQGTTFCLFWRSGVTTPTGTGGRGMGFNEQNWVSSAVGNGEKHYNLNWSGFLAAADTMRFGIRHDDTVSQTTLSNQNLSSSDPRLTEIWVTKHG